MLKHFIKTLGLFVILIILGLFGVFLVNYFDEGDKIINTENNSVQLAE